MIHQTISATVFKAKCLSLLDQVNRDGGSVTITKRGHVVGVLSAPKKARFKSSEGSWAGWLEPLERVEDLDMTDLYEDNLS